MSFLQKNQEGLISSDNILNRKIYLYYYKPELKVFISLSGADLTTALNVKDNQIPVCIKTEYRHSPEDRL